MLNVTLAQKLTTCTVNYGATSRQESCVRHNRGDTTDDDAKIIFTLKFLLRRRRDLFWRCLPPTTFQRRSKDVRSNDVWLSTLMQFRCAQWRPFMPTDELLLSTDQRHSSARLPHGLPRLKRTPKQPATPLLHAHSFTKALLLVVRLPSIAPLRC